MAEAGIATISGADLLVVGGGPVGMATALAAARDGRRVRLFDARPADSWHDDPRAIALSEGSRQFLARLGAWPVHGATPINEVLVSQQAGGRCRLTAAEQRLPQLGHVVAYGELCAALARAIAAAGSAIEMRADCRVGSVAEDSTGVELDTGGERHRGLLLVHAEGVATEESLSVDYAQDALLATVTPAHPHRHVAHECFTPQGPVALLPLGGNYAVVFVVARNAGSDLEYDDPAFLEALAERLGGEPAITACGPRQRVPLWLRARPCIGDGRQIWLGNAAQSLHPISGQGLNLGLRDAACFAEALARHRDADARQALAAYRRQRGVDRALTIGFTDLLARIFPVDLPPLARARGLALDLLDLAGPARRQLARHMVFGRR